MSARTPKYSCAPPSARRKPAKTSSKISTILRSVQTARRCFSQTVYDSLSKCALRAPSTSEESEGGRGVARAGLHVAPPAVIGPAETHKMSPAGVVAREPHHLHDRLRSGHVKR